MNIAVRTYIVKSKFDGRVIIDKFDAEQGRQVIGLTNEKRIPGHE